MEEKNENPVFAAVDIIKEFNGRRVLSISRLSFARGKVYCLYGPNGAGKTTLFEILTFLQRPTKGTILFNGKEVGWKEEGLSGLRSQVTLVHQNPLLFSTTVERNVDYGLRIRKVPKHEREMRVEECLKIVGLGGFQKRKPRELSGGEAQRVAIARALSIRPEVLFLDEFSANLDSEHRTAVEKIIQRINKTFGTTIIFTTHYKDQAYRLSDNVIHIFNGKVVQSPIRNIFRGTIRKENGRMVFKNSRIRIVVTSGVEGDAVIAIPMTAITVSGHALDSSMRNILQGKIRHVIDDDKSVIIRVSAGEVLEAVITKDSYRMMGLEPGADIYLNFKASSVEVL